MRYLLLATAVIFSMLMSVTTETQEIGIGETLPMADTPLKNIDKKKTTLTECAKDRGLLVIFSCNTCPFVIGNESFPGWEKDYARIHEIANKNNIGFVLINSNEAKRKKGDGMKDMMERAKEYNYSMPYLYDKDHKVADAFGAKTTPHVYLFDASMKLIYKGSIDDTYKPTINQENKTNFLENAIISNATGKTIEPSSTPPKGCSIKRKS